MREPSFETLLMGLHATRFGEPQHVLGSTTATYERPRHETIIWSSVTPGFFWCYRAMRARTFRPSSRPICLGEEEYFQTMERLESPILEGSFILTKHYTRS